MIKKTVITLLVLFIVFKAFVHVSIFVELMLSPTAVRSTDYLPNLMGALMVRDGQGHNLYDFELQHFYQNEVLKNDLPVLMAYKNMPVNALLLLPFSTLDIRTGYLLFILLNIVATVVGVLLLTLDLKLPFQKLVLAVGLLLGFSPFFYTLVYGQTTGFMFLIVVLLYLAFVREKYFLQGLLVGLLLLKLNLLFLTPFMFILTPKKLRFLAGYVVSSLVLLGVSVGISGWRFLYTYPTYLVTSESAQFGTYLEHSYSLRPLLHLLTQNNGSQFLINALLLCCTLGIYWFYTKGRFSDQAFFAALSLGLVFGYHIHIQDTLLLFIPILLVLYKHFPRDLISLAPIIFVYGFFGIFWDKQVFANGLLLLVFGFWYIVSLAVRQTSVTVSVPREMV